MNARTISLEALQAVDVRAAYADLALSACLNRQEVNAAQRKLATELVYGTVRRLNTLDWAIGLFLKRPLSDCDPLVRAALRMGAYQLLYTDHIPGPVAVDATVAALASKQRRATGLVNAVLRRLSELDRQLPYPDPEHEPELHLALRYSHPEWMIKRMLPRLGLQETIEWCQFNNRPPTVTLRVNRSRCTMDQFTGLLNEQGILWEKGKHHEQAVRLRGGGRLRELPGYSEGFFQVQDEASMLVGTLLAPLSGEKVLDMCAAPGGKTTHLAEMMNDQGQVLAVDVHSHRLQLVTESAKRLGLNSIQISLGDARQLPYGAVFDRVLLDAPCSGLGVLAKRPDARWRRGPEQVPSLVALQRELLGAAGGYVQTGGVLVYSVCTLTEEEGAGMIRAFLAENPAFALDNPPSLFEQLGDSDGSIQIWPHRHNMDGFFMARLRKSH